MNTTTYACVLAEVEVGRAYEAAAHLKTLAPTGLVALTAGPYDLMIIVRCEDSARLGQIVINELQRAPGILSTLTLPFLGPLELQNWLAAQAHSAE